MELSEAHQIIDRQHNELVGHQEEGGFSPLSEWVMAQPSTEKCVAGEPPLAKQVKDDDPLPPVCVSYNIEQWSSCESMELPCSSKKDHKGKQRDDSGLPPKTGDSTRPTADVPNPAW